MACLGLLLKFFLPRSGVDNLQKEWPLRSGRDWSWGREDLSCRNLLSICDPLSFLLFDTDLGVKIGMSSNFELWVGDDVPSWILVGGGWENSNCD